MQSIDIEHPTPKQLLKMYRGEKVRVRRGTGFNITVHPQTYNIVARAFNRSKGVDIGLSPEELKAMDISTGLQRIQQYDTAGNPINIEGFKAGVGSTQMNNPLAPANAPHAREVGTGLRGVSGIVHPHKSNSMAQQVEQIKHYGEMNKHLGTNFDYLGKAGYAKAVANDLSSKLSEESFKARYPEKTQSEQGYHLLGSGFNHRMDRTIMGRGVSLLHSQVVPPAYASQPHGANFQFNHFLPPEFQSEAHIHGGSLHTHTHNLKSKTSYVNMSPHLYDGGFPESVVMPPYYTSKAEDVDFIRQSMKNPETKPEAKHRKRRKHPTSGHGLYAGGSGLYAGKGLGP